jgi:hypothetical protein
MRDAHGPPLQYGILAHLSKDIEPSPALCPCAALDNLFLLRDVSF